MILNIFNNKLVVIIALFVLFMIFILSYIIIISNTNNTNNTNIKKAKFTDTYNIINYIDDIKENINDQLQFTKLSSLDILENSKIINSLGFNNCYDAIISYKNNNMNINDPIFYNGSNVSIVTLCPENINGNYQLINNNIQQISENISNTVDKNAIHASNKMQKLNKMLNSKLPDKLSTVTTNLNYYLDKITPSGELKPTTLFLGKFNIITGQYKLLNNWNIEVNEKTIILSHEQNPVFEYEYIIVKNELNRIYINLYSMQLFGNHINTNLTINNIENVSHLLSALNFVSNSFIYLTLEDIKHGIYSIKDVSRNTILQYERKPQITKNNIK